MDPQIPDTDLIVLLDDSGREIGTAPKLASHHATTPLHKAFSCYIFDEQGRFLVTQRAHTKKVWPDVWTNSVCGHPAPGESYEAAIARRADYELGMTVRDTAVIVSDYRYATPPYNGIVENEICPVFAARLATNSQVNPDEVEAFRWILWADYVADIATHPNTYSYWAKDQLPHLLQSADFLRYTRPA